LIVDIFWHFFGAIVICAISIRDRAVQKKAKKGEREKGQPL